MSYFIIFSDPELEIDIDKYNREYMAQSEVSVTSTYILHHWLSYTYLIAMLNWSQVKLSRAMLNEIIYFEGEEFLVQRSLL